MNSKNETAFAEFSVGGMLFVSMILLYYAFTIVLSFQYLFPFFPLILPVAAVPVLYLYAGKKGDRNHWVWLSLMFVFYYAQLYMVKPIFEFFGWTMIFWFGLFLIPVGFVCTGFVKVHSEKPVK